MCISLNTINEIEERTHIQPDDSLIIKSGKLLSGITAKTAVCAYTSLRVGLNQAILPLLPKNRARDLTASTNEWVKVTNRAKHSINRPFAPQTQKRAKTYYFWRQEETITIESHTLTDAAKDLLNNSIEKSRATGRNAKNLVQKVQKNQKKIIALITGLALVLLINRSPLDLSEQVRYLLSQETSHSTAESVTGATASLLTKGLCISSFIVVASISTCAFYNRCFPRLKSTKTNRNHFCNSQVGTLSESDEAYLVGYATNNLGKSHADIANHWNSIADQSEQITEKRAKQILEANIRSYKRNSNKTPSKELIEALTTRWFQEENSGDWNTFMNRWNQTHCFQCDQLAALQLMRQAFFEALGPNRQESFAVNALPHIFEKEIASQVESDRHMTYNDIACNHNQKNRSCPVTEGDVKKIKAVARIYQKQFREKVKTLWNRACKKGCFDLEEFSTEFLTHLDKTGPIIENTSIIKLFTNNPKCFARLLRRIENPYLGDRISAHSNQTQAFIHAVDHSDYRMSRAKKAQKWNEMHRECPYLPSEIEGIEERLRAATNS